MKGIKIEPEQLEELMKLCGEHSPVSDMTTADDIYMECMKQRAGRDYRWAHYCAVATVLRTGYILGQRAERARLSSVKAGGRQHE